MARTWTDEQREAQRQRARVQGFGARVEEHGPALAAVELHRVPPHRSPEVIIAEQEGRIVKTVDHDLSEDGSPVRTTHTRPGTKVMYKPTEHHGYVPKIVSGSAVRLLLVQGWYEYCPECNSEHLDRNGQHSADPNLCTARPPLAVRVCPVCRKRIYDNVRFLELIEEEAADDPNVIQDDEFLNTTPAERTAASLNLHLWVRHPRYAQMANIPPLPVALRDMVEEPRPA